jgi:hypothetical protein
MALLDLQAMTTESKDGGQQESNLSLLLCQGNSELSLLVCD